MGGVTEFMKVAALAQAHDLPLAAHGTQDVHVHLMTAVPNGLILEYYSTSTDPPLRAEMLMDNLQVEDGCVRPPDKPGLGIEPNEEVLRRYRVS